MKTSLVNALQCITIAAFAQAFDTLAVSKPPISNSPGYEYPRIDNDNRAIFRVRAPQAKKVQVDLGGLQDMTMGADSMWTVITKPLVPGFHYYWLVIDGVRVADPASESYFGTGKMTSGIEVPTPGEDFWRPQKCTAWRRKIGLLFFENHE